ncbi:hypothetical protein Bca4012_058350 [Brassica carinata]
MWQPHTSLLLHANIFRPPLPTGFFISTSPTIRKWVKPPNDLLVIVLTIQDIDVARILIDTRCSINFIFKNTLEKMKIDFRAITENPCPIFGLSGEATMTLGSIDLMVKAGSIEKITEFLIVDRPMSYNVIMGTPWLNSMRAIPSTYHMCLKFPTPYGVETIQGDHRISQVCSTSELKRNDFAVKGSNNDMYMPSSTRSNKESQLLFLEDPPSLERSIRKEILSASIDAINSLSTDTDA